MSQETENAKIHLTAAKHALENAAALVEQMQVYRERKCALAYWAMVKHLAAELGHVNQALKQANEILLVVDGIPTPKGGLLN